MCFVRCVKAYFSGEGVSVKNSDGCDIVFHERSHILLHILFFTFYIQIIIHKITQ